MSSPQPSAGHASHRLRTARVIRVEEDACEIRSGDEVRSVRFAPSVPSPRTERVFPGHLVAVATGPDGSAFVVWRWYDAVVLGTEDDGSVRLWEPAHGEVFAQARASYQKQVPGSRAYVSAGLPGAEWWVADSAGAPHTPNVELDDVDALYTENNLWSSVFEWDT
jgi:hypothetical protein